jgi:hypothetical protein
MQEAATKKIMLYIKSKPFAQKNAKGFFVA